jgi:UDP-glucose 4-epimerase
LGGEVTYIPKRPGEPECTFADTSKIKKLLKWHSQVSFESGVKIMLENINNWSSAPVWDPKGIGEATKDWFRYLSK